MNKEFMEQAIKLASNAVASNTGGPFGAIIVKDGVIVGRGNNQVLANNDPTAHAEVVAIRDACKQLNNFWLEDCEIYTSCEPCPMCLGAIYWSRINKIYFGANRDDAASIGFDDRFFYEELAQPTEKRSVPMLALMRDAALIPFNAWKDKQDKTRY